MLEYVMCHYFVDILNRFLAQPVPDMSFHDKNWSQVQDFEISNSYAESRHGLDVILLHVLVNYKKYVETHK